MMTRRAQLSPTTTRGASSDADTRSLRVVTFRCEPVADAEPQALAVTYFFDAAAVGPSGRLTVRFAGRRLGVKGKPARRDQFTVTDSVDGMSGASGRVALTTRVFDIAPGEWHVTAKPIGATGNRTGSALLSGSTVGRTSFAPVMRVCAHGARLGVWPALVGVGTVVALAMQAALARHANLPSARVLTVSLIASIVGLLGAKAYYIVEHRGARQSVLNAGMCEVAPVRRTVGYAAMPSWRR